MDEERQQLLTMCAEADEVLSQPGILSTVKTARIVVNRNRRS